MKRRNLTLVLAVALAAVVILLLINGGRTGFAQSRTTIRLDTITLGPGEQGAVTAQIECGAGQCGAFDLSIRFDPAIIQVDRLEIGPYLGTQPVVVENTFDNQAGSIDVAAAALGTPPPIGSTVLLTLYVTASGTGSTPLHIQEAEVSDLVGNAQDVLPSDGTVTVISGSSTPGEVRVGISAGYAPFEYLDDAGNITGFDVALITALAQQAGLEFRLINTPWADIFSALTAGQLDLIISGIAITPDREATVDFSNPYYYVSLRIVAQQGRAAAIQGVENLTGLRIGVLKDSAGDSYANTLPGLSITRYESTAEAFQALSLGSVDALIFDGTLAADMIEKNPSLGVVLTGLPLGEVSLGIAVQPGQSALLNTINIALHDIIINGTYEQIFQNWFNARPPEMFRSPAAAILPTLAPTLSMTPPPTATLAASQPSVTVQNSSVNLRGGPGVEYGVVGIARRGERFIVIAQARGWWLILGPDDSPAWIAGWIVAVDPPDAQVELAATIPPAPAVAPAASGGGGGAAPTAASGQVCSPGQWAGCGVYGCGADYSARCNTAGTGYECIWNPAGCSGGGGGDGGGGNVATKVPTPPRPPS